MTNTIKLKGVLAEDFIQYKVPSLFLSTAICDWKCCHDGSFPESWCQNEPLAKAPTKEFSIESIYNFYMSNDITKAIVVGGLEPFKQFDELCSLISYFRENNCFDDFVIYTGYYYTEIEDELAVLQKFPNIVIKFGRYIPNDESKFDEVLGIRLVSSNQYARRIS